MIVARTIKGYGASETADKEGKHGQPLKDPKKAIEELGNVGPVHVDVAKPESSGTPHVFDSDPSVPLPTYEVGGDKVPTRLAFGQGLAAVMQRRGDVVALDGEVGNSTHLEEVLKQTPERYFEVYIAEQMLMAGAVGFQVRGWTPFASTFAAFLSRAYDFVRMAVISQAKLCINGSHAGVSIGEDGPSQMALEDLAEFRALGKSVVLYPSDPNQTVKLVDAMADYDGISYLRSSRSGTDTIYGPDEEFHIGGAKVVRSSDDDQVTLIGAGRDVARGDQGRRRARRRRDRRPGDRPLLGQAGRRRDAVGSVRRHRRPADHGRGSLARGRDRRRGAGRVRRRRRAAARGQARGHAPAGVGQGRGAPARCRDRLPTRSSPPPSGWPRSARRSAAPPQPPERLPTTARSRSRERAVVCASAVDDDLAGHPPGLDELVRARGCPRPRSRRSARSRSSGSGPRRPARRPGPADASARSCRASRTASA